MKTIKLTIVFVLICFSTTIWAQNLEKMSEHNRNNILIQRAKAAIMKHGPDFYRAHVQPVIGNESNAYLEMCINSYKNVAAQKDTIEMIKWRWVEDVLNGRKLYTVTYPNNPNEEYFQFKYSAMIYIWADNGKAFMINFGIGLSKVNIDDPKYVKKNKNVIKHTKQPPIVLKGPPAKSQSKKKFQEFIEEQNRKQQQQQHFTPTIQLSAYQMF